MTYNYFDAVKADVLDYIRAEIDLTEWAGQRDELKEKLNDELWTADSVTGNGSGSYTFNSYEAAEYLAHNWDLLRDALEDFGQADTNPIAKGEEWCDVTIRCYLLGQAIAEALDELEASGELLDAMPDASDEPNACA